MEIPSPCRGVCQYDEIMGWCIGCGRTETEIARWQSFTNNERLLLIRTELKRRLKQMGRWPMTGVDKK